VDIIIAPAPCKEQGCSVRTSQLGVKVKGMRIPDWAANYSRCHLEPDWATPDPRALVLAEFNLQFRFTKLSSLPVTGDSRVLKERAIPGRPLPRTRILEQLPLLVREGRRGGIFDPLRSTCPRRISRESLDSTGRRHPNGSRNSSPDKPADCKMKNR
jgi:hypothetical protein